LRKVSLFAFCVALVGMALPGTTFAHSCNANSPQGRAGLSCGAATQNHPTTTSTMNGNSQGPTGPVPVANQLPLPPAKPPIQIVKPNTPPPAITGYAPVPPIQTLPPHVVTGYAPVPTPTSAVPPLPPQTPLPPQPPQPVVAPPVPQPYLVPPTPQPVAVGVQGPSLTGYAPASQTTSLPPQGILATAKPKPVPKVVIEIGKPIPHEITSKADSAKGNSTMIANVPGRQNPKQYPEFSDPRSGLTKGCILSGLDRRQVALPDGGAIHQGALPHLRTVSSVIADIPSWDHHEFGCIVSINKK
jgi:hypothetical protein